MSILFEESILKNPLLIAILPALIVAVFNYIIAHVTKAASIRVTYYEKRFLEFYLPVFQHIEPQLFKKISYDEADDFHQYLETMIKEHYMLINDRIIDRHCLMKINLKSKKINVDSKKPEYLEDFYSICKHLDSDITFLQNKLGLPTRGFIYRYNHKQLTFSSLFYGRVLGELIDSFVIPYVLAFSIIFLLYYFELLGK